METSAEHSRTQLLYKKLTANQTNGFKKATEIANCAGIQQNTRASMIQIHTPPINIA
jgi:hypothetical protein